MSKKSIAAIQRRRLVGRLARAYRGMKYCATRRLRLTWATNAWVFHHTKRKLAELVGPEVTRRIVADLKRTCKA